MNVKNMKGFTLIELMIVVAIIAILAAIALPAYQDYTIRSQVSEGSVLADGAKTAYAEYHDNRGKFPPSNASAGLPASNSIIGNYVTDVNVATALGKITVTYGNQANTNIQTKVLVFSSYSNGGSLAWSCGPNAGTNIALKYLPTKCRQ
ncbi:MAG TPA: pilin [Rhodanobacteraceae bacterium]|nr:pilin [Rhodanobacteraceae bacterium]